MIPHLPRARTSALALAAVLAIAACGSDDTTSEPADTAVDATGDAMADILWRSVER